MDLKIAHARDITPFDFKWPGGNVEHFEPAWELAASVDGRDAVVKYGLTEREAFGRMRARGVAWVNGQVVLEATGTDDYDDSHQLITLAKLPSNRRATSIDEVPPEYAGIAVVEHRAEIQTERKRRALAFKMRDDDLDGWARCALIRHTLRTAAGGVNSGAERWDEFVRWAARFYESRDFEADERSYKIEIADHLRAARSALDGGGGDWVQLLHDAFGKPNNLTSWRMHTTFLQWVTGSQEQAKSALSAIWSAEESDLAARVDAFCSRLPSEVVAGRGSRVSLASFLQMAIDEYTLPFFKPTPVETAYRLTDHKAPAREAGEGAAYQHFLGFVDQFVDEAEERGLAIADRLDAQGLIWRVTSVDPPTTWTVEEKETLMRYRGGEPPTKSGAVNSMLVGAVTERSDALQAEIDSIRERIDQNGAAASWWSFPLVGDKAAVARQAPYLYFYVGQPVQALTHRLHIKDVKTSEGEAGLTSPWPDSTKADETDKARLGPGQAQVFKTWFLFDTIEELEERIPLARLSAAGGGPAQPSALVNGFAIWTITPPVADVDSGRAELLDATNLEPGELEELETLLRTKRQIILEGPPGSGKTFIAELLGRYLSGNPLTGPYSETFEIVQFHQSYGYEDFVQGIRPVTREDGSLEYRVVDGVFRRFAETATKNPDKTFVMLVDEINRGNVSRIFGELLLLLEYRDKRVALPYALPSDPPFRIPERLYLIGTMNTADRSLAQIDYALRRRFLFYRLSPTIGGRAPILERWLGKRKEITPDQALPVLRAFVRLNERLVFHLGEHFQVGHSYFMDPDIAKPGRLQTVWRRAIMPLLEEYFYSRRDLQQVLGEFRLEDLLADSDQSAAAEAQATATIPEDDEDG